MGVTRLAAPYQTAEEKSHIKNWLNRTVGLRVDAVNTDDQGATKSVNVTVFTADADDPGTPSRVESARIIGQIAQAGVAVGDVLVCHIVAHGKRGQILGVPTEKDKDAAAITERFS